MGGNRRRARYLQNPVARVEAKWEGAQLLHAVRQADRKLATDELRVEQLLRPREGAGGKLSLKAAVRRPPHMGRARRRSPSGAVRARLLQRRVARDAEEVGEVEPSHRLLREDRDVKPVFGRGPPSRDVRRSAVRRRGARLGEPVDVRAPSRGADGRCAAQAAESLAEERELWHASEKTRPAQAARKRSFVSVEELVAPPSGIKTGVRCFVYWPLQDILVAPCFKNLLRLEAGYPALRCHNLEEAHHPPET